MPRASRIRHGQQGLVSVNNNHSRQLPHDTMSSCFPRLFLALGFVALCGCHYCPHNRHVLKPGQSCASDYIGTPYACHPGGRRNGGGCTDGRCDRGSASCTDGQCESYYPTPERREAPPVSTDSDATTQQPIDVTTEAPVEIRVQEPSTDPAPLQPFAPLESFPPPPSTSVDAPAVADPLAPAPEPSAVDPVTPLFEGRVELDEIEVAPEQLSLPEATPTPVEPPTPAIPTQPEVRSIEEDNDDSAFKSLFRLQLPPRLFRLRDDSDEGNADADPAESQPAAAPGPSISEASGTQGSRLLYGHSLTTPAWAQ